MINPTCARGMRIARLRWRIPPLALLVLLPQFVLADIEIQLSKKFVNDYRLRATVTTDYKVKKTHHQPNKPKDDGDIHCAGAPQAHVGFATVAEIMNAKDAPEALTQLVQAEGTDDVVHLTGVWRLWPEHADAGEAFTQGAFDESEIVSTNPAHVFEIHPLTVVNDIDVRHTFGPIQGFTYKTAAQAFAEYNNKTCNITPGPGPNAITLITKKTGYNYVRFIVRLLETPTKRLGANPQSEATADGMAFFGNAIDPDAENEEEEVLTGKIRFIIVKGTSAYDELKQRNAGDRVLVVGVPRVDLSLVKWRAEHATANPAVAQRTLPYEIVIVGILNPND
jgi:hypothetical protein